MSESADTTYEPLVARYRPRRLKDIAGQEVAKTHIQGMLQTGKISRQILITGPFGCGKTTFARIIARYINCLNSGPAKACGECQSCKMLSVSGELQHPDVLEINASSDRGIETIRTLNEIQQLNPQCRYKVFIIDEAHGLTGQAASAFLKTLEEPAKRSVFILCTTNPEKILRTVTSRCLNVKLFPLQAKELSPRLLKIAKAEKFKLSEEDATKIAELSRGHARDALQMLETVIHYVAAKKEKMKDLGDKLPQILQEVIRSSPVHLAEKYVQLVLNGSYNAVSLASDVDSPEYFFQLVITIIKQVIFARKVPKLSDNQYRAIANAEYSYKLRTKDLLRLYKMYLEGYEMLKRYIVDAKDALDSTSLSAVGYVSELPENKKSGKDTKTENSNGTKGSLLGERFKKQESSAS